MLEHDDEFLRSPSPVRSPLKPVTTFVSASRKLRQVSLADFHDAVENERDVEGEAAEAEKARGDEGGGEDVVGEELEVDAGFFDGGEPPAAEGKTGSLRRMAEAGPDKEAEPAPLLELDDDFAGVEDGERPPVKKRAVVVDDEMELGDESAPVSNGHPVAELIPPPVASSSRTDIVAPRSTSTSKGPQWILAAPLKATTFDGRTVHFPKRRRVGGEGAIVNDEFRNGLGLGAVPIHQLMDQARRELKEDAERRAQPAALPNGATKGKGALTGEANGTLWTDKYRPRKYVELLGDDRVFRTAMSWLKEWDACVFKSSISAASRRRAAKKRTSAAAFGGLPAPFKAFASTATTAAFSPGVGDAQQSSDPLGRPNEKVLLLCGPPGLGKTTMAHVLASQAGYAVLEVNASDDRTAKVVTERIRGATETRTLDRGAKKGGGMTLGDNRPTCVIVDEIDGAAGGAEGGFVKALAKMIVDGTAVKKAAKGKGKKGVENKPLVRPIICICNDLYAPVLRPLRPLARIIRFSPPTNTVLANRLRTICESERLRTDLKNLNQLIEMSAGDLRNCLNSLQFIKRQGSDRVDEVSMRSASVGSKDTGTSAQAALSALFRPAKAKKMPAPDDGLYVDRLARDVSTCGEYERLAQGCFEAYPLAKAQAGLWDAYEDAGGWLDFYDSLDRRIRSSQAYELLGYVPYSLVPFHPLFANATNKAPEYPRVEYETYVKKLAHQEILDAFRYGLPPRMRDSFTTTNILCELVPLLMRILSPDLKPVNAQLIRKEEKEVLRRLVGQMVEMNLAFVQDRAEDGQLTYKLEPPIDVFIHYEGKRAADIPASRYGIRHLVAKAMEAEAIKRAEGTVADDVAGGIESIIAAYKTKPTESQVAVQEAAAVDFFGRKIDRSLAREGSSTTALPTKKVLGPMFKFHEGFSTAVKKPIKLRELLSR